MRLKGYKSTLFLYGFMLVLLGSNINIIQTQSLSESDQELEPAIELAQIVFNRTESLESTMMDPDWAWTWFVISPDNRSFIDSKAFDLSKPHERNELAFDPSGYIGQNIYEILTNGVDNILDFHVGLVHANTTLYGESMDKGFESKYFENQTQSIDFEGTTLINITLVVNDLTIITEEGLHKVNIDVIWIFYGYPYIVDIESPKTSGPSVSTLFIDSPLLFGGIILGLIPLATILYSWNSQSWIFNRRRTRFTNGIIRQFKELFNGSSSYMLSLSGRFYQKNPPKSFRDPLLEGYPENLLQFKFLLHPARMSIMKILFNSISVQTNNLKSVLGLSWGEIAFHLKKLEEKEYVSITDRFIDGSTRQVIELLPSGSQRFKELTSELLKFLTDNNSLMNYLDSARQISEEDKDRQT